MPLQIGIIGKPNAGKSTLFNALVQRYQAKVAPYPFTTIDPNVGVVEVPDPRLNRIAETLKLPKKIPATIEFVDIAGLVKGAHTGEGLGNQFLSHIRGVDAIMHIVRGFADPTSKETPDPSTAYQTIRDELKAADESKDIPPEQKLTTKPELVVINLPESKVADAKVPLGLPPRSLIMSAKLESDLIELPEPERVDYLKTLNLSESLLPRVIQAAYDLLSLITFYTLLPNQVQAWPIPKDTKAPLAAGKIHTDFQAHFIKAEVISFDDFVSKGGEQGAKQAGKMRIEGKNYVVKDGDVIYFRVAT